MKLDEFCKTLDDKLAQAAGDEALRLSALALQQAFKVAEDEVAFLVLTPESNCLQFIWPTKLSKAGTIPLSTRDSLAATTARQRQPMVNNRFSSTYHASIFEQIRLGNPKDPEKRPKTIHKIMSVPLLHGEDCIGAAQVCRKGEDANQAGDDFSKTELEALAEISKIIARHIPPREVAPNG